MPFYRVCDLMVHVNLGGRARKNPPAQCVAKIALQGRQTKCCGMSAYLCDWKLSDGTTCNAPLCAEHAHQVGANEHLCPLHLAKRDELFPKLF